MRSLYFFKVNSPPASHSTSQALVSYYVRIFVSSELKTNRFTIDNLNLYIVPKVGHSNKWDIVGKPTLQCNLTAFRAF